jgi:hypothetical protein
MDASMSFIIPSVKRVGWVVTQTHTFVTTLSWLLFPNIIISPTSSGRSVGIVRWRAKVPEYFLMLFSVDTVKIVQVIKRRFANGNMIANCWLRGVSLKARPHTMLNILSI